MEPLIARGFYIPFSKAPRGIDHDLYLIEDDLALESYYQLESGTQPSAEELRKWTDAWVHDRLEIRLTTWVAISGAPDYVVRTVSETVGR